MKMKKILKENTTGQRIKAARVRKGLTQEELAELLYLPKSNISAYENDRVKLREDVIVDLANVLDVSTDYLLGRKKPEEDPYMQEAVELLEKITDEKERETVLKMLRGVVG